MTQLEKSMQSPGFQHGAMSYTQYFERIEELLKLGKTTGKVQKESYLKHTRLNFQRMKRVYRTTKISSELQQVIKSIEHKHLWVGLSEGWCGDAAQNLPAIARLAELNEQIDLKILLRDENPELMDGYLTNGSRSIPKVIVYDQTAGRELFTWGPRPMFFQDMVMENKRNPKMPSADFEEHLHREYTKDKTQKLQSEFEVLLKTVTA
jgi:hypothetical protein